MSEYDKLWLKAMLSCLDHEGKMIPYFWRKNKEIVK
jgi:hypothetical protein